MPRKREPSPFDVVESIQLSKINCRNTPEGFAERVLSRPTDYEIILGQAYELAHLRSLLKEQADD